MKTLALTLHDYKIIKIKDIYGCTDQYKMYAIVGLDCNAKYKNTDDLLNDYNVDKSFKIEYIGISIKHTAASRLTKHNTFQKILIDYQTNKPNRELYIVLFNTKNFDIKTVEIEELKDDVKDKTAEDIEKSALDFMKQFNIAYTDTDVITALSEAGLINIFKPRYNTEYINCTYKTLFSTCQNLYDYSFEKGFYNIYPRFEHRGRGKIKIYTDYYNIILVPPDFNIQLQYPFSLKNK